MISPERNANKGQQKSKTEIRVEEYKRVAEKTGAVITSKFKNGEGLAIFPGNNPISINPISIAGSNEGKKTE